MERGTGPRSPAAPAARLGRAQAKASARQKQLALRKKHGKLKNSLVQPYTLVRYRLAVRWFFEWITRNGFEIPSHTVDFDDVVCEAIEGAWAEGEPRGLMGNVLSGLEFEVQSLRGQLRASWKLFRHWGVREKPSRVPPLSTNAVLALSYYMWDWGYKEAAIAT